VRASASEICARDFSSISTAAKALGDRDGWTFQSTLALSHHHASVNHPPTPAGHPRSPSCFSQRKLGLSCCAVARLAALIFPPFRFLFIPLRFEEEGASLAEAFRLCLMIDLRNDEMIENRPSFPESRIALSRLSLPGKASLIE
jgi:hypothetical protein